MLPSWCPAASAIGEQAVDVCTELSRSAKRLCLAASSISAARKGGSEDRISHPDWGEIMRRIKLRAKPKYENSFCYNVNNMIDILNDTSKFTRPGSVGELDKTATQEQCVQRQLFVFL